MSLMMPDGKSWTQPYQNPYAAPTTQQQQQTQNTQRNDQQWGQGNWAYNQSPSPQPSGGTKAPDMSAYSPGKAQPVQQPSTGTPYGQQPAQQDNPYANMAPGVYYGGQQIQGNQQQALDTAMQMRNAMVVQANNNNLKYQMANAFGKDLGQPTFDYDSAMKQAQDMVANGFYNPFNEYYANNPDPFNQIGQYAPPSLYDPQQPIGGFTPPFAGMPTQPNFGGQPVSKQSIYQPLTPPPAPEQPEYSHKQVPGSEWDQVEQAWKLPAKPAAPRPDYGPNWPDIPYSRAPMEVTLATPRVSPTTPTSGILIQRPDGQLPRAPQWKPAYGGYDPTAFYDDQGSKFGGTQSYAPGTSLKEMEDSYRRFAENMGYYNRDANGNRVGSQPGTSPTSPPNFAPVLPPPRSAPGRAQPVQPPSQGTPYAGPEKKPAGTVATAPKKPPAPAARPQTPDDIAAIEAANKYKAANLTAFKQQFADNVRSRRHATAGMSQELLQAAQLGVESGDRDWGAYADVLYGPGAVSRMYSAGHYR